VDTRILITWRMRASSVVERPCSGN